MLKLYRKPKANSCSIHLNEKKPESLHASENRDQQMCLIYGDTEALRQCGNQTRANQANVLLPHRGRR